MALMNHLNSFCMLILQLLWALLNAESDVSHGFGRESLRLTNGQQFQREQQPMLPKDDRTPSSRSIFSSPSASRGSYRVELSELSMSAMTAYDRLLEALDIMEDRFFEVSDGTWPDAIDWTAEVMATQISASLATMSEYIEQIARHPVISLEEAKAHENLINRYFTQITSFYFGENAFSLRTQAYDDMLWVVLGWLESIKFIRSHSNLHYGVSSTPLEGDHSGQKSSWYACQFIPQFAHRARLFYDLAAKGWDTTLCGGGMIWSPYLAPYKNAITNQLFIAASAAMYLYFPGDHNASPFHTPTAGSSSAIPPASAHDDRYLKNAIAGYDWLKKSKMRNEKGLYVDGYHISGWRGGHHPSNGSRKCDLRAETVYSYNQGVILSGLRGLWEATGDRAYLEDGHELVREVITATGWHDRDDEGRRYRWAGLGRGGVLEEQCDWSGTCSQDGQTFKGIYFHHFSTFCAALPRAGGHDDDDDRDRRPWLGDEDVRSLHQQSCAGYAAWVRKNAQAAWVTRDEEGVMGGWWGRPARGSTGPDRHRHDGREKETQEQEQELELERPMSDQGAVDYRNDGVPNDAVWRVDPDSDDDQNTSPIRKDKKQLGPRYPYRNRAGKNPRTQDLNDRGRGRTVETQSGGVAVLRASWNLHWID